MKVKLQRTSPNYRQKLSTTKIMNYLTIGLSVIAIYSIINPFFTKGDMATAYSIKALSIYLVSIGVALITESVWAYIHKKPISKQIKTSFPLVTALILALSLPIGTPLYVVALGSFFAIFLGKLVYGGFGQNIFNPALVGRVIVHISFGSSLSTSLTTSVDAMTTATPVAYLSSNYWMVTSDYPYTLLDLFLGNHGGTLGETCIWIILVVGIVLAFLKVFDPRIPLSYIGTMLILAEVFALVNGFNPITYPLMQICMGGIFFGAVFMATDPVTSPTSPFGKIIYGICLGCLTMIIRFKANFPEGALFSILIMNMFTPLIDSLITGRTNQKIKKQLAIIGVILLIGISGMYGISISVRNASQNSLAVNEEMPIEEVIPIEREVNRA